MLSAPHGAPQTRLMVPCSAMQSIIFEQTVLLIGNAPLSELERAWVNRFDGPVICADGGRRHWDGCGAIVIGDGDSIEAKPDDQIIIDHDQNTTDLGKCLARVKAPAMTGVGFLGGRWDHSLANLSALLKHPHLTLLDQLQQIQGCNGQYRGLHQIGETLGVIPAESCTFKYSTGLRYPLDGLLLEPGGAVGSSNTCKEAEVRVEGQGNFWWICASPIN